MSRLQGIYAITNCNDGKETTYIGSSVNIKSRWSFHRNGLRSGTHKNPYLQNAWNKYGENAFKFVVLENVDSIEYLIEREQFWLDKTKSERPVYNQGECVDVPARGRVQSSEEKQRRRKSILSLPDEVKRHIVEVTRKVHTGKIVTAETRMRMSAARSGKKLSSETRKKIGIASKLNWSNPEYHKREAAALVKRMAHIKRANGGVGHVVSEEMKNRLRELFKGRKYTEETHQRMSNGAKNRKKPRIRNARGQYE